MDSAESIEERTLEFDDEFTGVMEKYFDLIAKEIEASEVPATTRGMLGLMMTADSIKLGMISLAEAENIYASSILFRSLIEHYIRFNYLLFRLIEVKTDEPGKEYERFSQISEILETGEAYKVAATLEGRTTDTEPLAIMKEFDPTLGDLSKGEIDRITGKWKYRKVLRYIVEHLRKNTSIQTPFLANLVPIYGQLSSFVHGGKDAELTAAKMINEGRAPQVVWDQARWGCIIANSMKVFFVMVLAKNSQELRTAFAESSACMDRFLKRGDDPAPEAK